MLDVFVAVLVAIICLLILGVPITHFLLFISSQLLLVVFVFGNTCKTTFEAIIFLFVMHPYDVGDRCEIDGNQVKKILIWCCLFHQTLAFKYRLSESLFPNFYLIPGGS